VDEKQSKSDRVEELGRDMETLRSSLDERTAEVTSMKTLLQEKDSQLTLTKVTSERDGNLHMMPHS
jgi:hypothetical protein